MNNFFMSRMKERLSFSRDSVQKIATILPYFIFLLSLYVTAAVILDINPKMRYPLLGSRLYIGIFGIAADLTAIILLAMISIFFSIFQFTGKNVLDNSGNNMQKSILHMPAFMFFGIGQICLVFLTFK
ncbi:hypothetical protein FBY58_1171 [Zymomonas mobilis]|uniref:Uncharacterized protein n=2 Tax=Zymomonas mobilis TaxID=542 RepID=A0A542W274_ZYMMB|nr:hypothetical protein FBY58_1171 [Zymomonas mobilis]